MEKKLISSQERRKRLKDVSDSEYRRLRELYDDFLEQPLTLGMFVPCDSQGNVLEEPKKCQYAFGDQMVSEKQWNRDCQQYQQAKDRVLFEGFKVKKVHELRIVLSTPEHVNFDLNWFLYKDGGGYFTDYKTVGDFTERLTNLELTLTPTACKQIGI